MFEHEDFSHLDDPNPHSLGTDHQLAAARSRGRALARHTRRNRLAAGSAAVAATAGVAGVAVVGLPSRSVAGTAADSSPSPYPIPTPTASSAPTPAPETATVSAVPLPASSELPYPSPSVAAPVPAQGTVSPTPVAVPTATISATAATVAPTVSASPTAPPTPAIASALPTTPTSDCATVTAHLKTSVLPSGYTPLAPSGGVIGWSHAGAPITSLVVTVSCLPFDPRQVTGDLPVMEVTVLDAHSWLIGDPATGKLQLTWNATDTTAVTVAAQVTLPEKTAQVEDLLLTLGNYLAD